MPVIEKAIETEALMLGSDRSRGYCLEMICAAFLAGVNLDNGGSGDPAVLDDEILQIPTRTAATGISRWPEREGIMSSTLNEPRSSAIAIRSGVVRSSASAGSASRCLAVSIVWHHVEPGSPPQIVSQPLGPRFRRKPDHTLCLLPRRDASPESGQPGLSADPANSIPGHQNLLRESLRTF
jgi:hypothetical protein